MPKDDDIEFEKNSKKDPLLDDSSGFNPDEEFDFDIDFDEESREPFSLAESFKQSTKQLTKLPTTEEIGKAIDENIPSEISTEYGLARETFNTATEAISKNWTHAKKELEPLTKGLEKLSTKMFGEESKITKLIDYLKPDQEYRHSRNLEEERTKEIEEELSRALGTTESLKTQINGIHEYLEDKRTLSTNELLGKIYKESAIVKTFNIDYVSNYQRKSLELQYRSNLFLRDLIENDKEHYRQYVDILKGIAHNTSIPDVMKQRQMELLGADIKTQFRSNVIDSFINQSSIVQTAKRNIENKVKDTFDSVVAPLSNIGMMFDMLDGLDLDYNSLPGELIRENLIGRGVKKGLKALIGTQKGREFAYGLKNFYDDPSGSFRGLQDNIEGTSFLHGAARKALGLGEEIFHMPISKTSPDLRRLALDQADSLDVRTKVSINRIIPGYLRKIHAEIKATRLQYTGDDPKDYELKYSHETDNFYAGNTLKTTIQEKVKKKMNSSLEWSLASLTSRFKEAGSDLSDEELKEFSEHLTRAVIQTHKQGSRFLHSREALSVIPEEKRERYMSLLSKIEEKSIEDLSYADGIRHSISNLRTSIPSMTKFFEELFKSGEVDALLDLDLIIYDESAGEYRPNDAGILAIMFETFNVHDEEAIKNAEGKAEQIHRDIGSAFNRAFKKGKGYFQKTKDKIKRLIFSSEERKATKEQIHTEYQKTREKAEKFVNDAKKMDKKEFLQKQKEVLKEKIKERDKKGYLKKAKNYLDPWIKKMNKKEIEKMIQDVKKQVEEDERLKKIKDPLMEKVEKYKDPIKEEINKYTDPLMKEVNKYSAPIVEQVNKYKDPIKEEMSKYTDPLMQKANPIIDKIKKEWNREDFYEVNQERLKKLKENLPSRMPTKQEITEQLTNIQKKIPTKQEVDEYYKQFLNKKEEMIKKSPNWKEKIKKINIFKKKPKEEEETHNQEPSSVLEQEAIKEAINKITEEPKPLEKADENLGVIAPPSNTTTTLGPRFDPKNDPGQSIRLVEMNDITKEINKIIIEKETEHKALKLIDSALETGNEDAVKEVVTRINQTDVKKSTLIKKKIKETEKYLQNREKMGAELDKLLTNDQTTEQSLSTTMSILRYGSTLLPFKATLKILGKGTWWLIKRGLKNEKWLAKHLYGPVLRKLLIGLPIGATKLGLKFGLGAGKLGLKAGWGALKFLNPFRYFGGKDKKNKKNQDPDSTNSSELKKIADPLDELLDRYGNDKNAPVKESKSQGWFRRKRENRKTKYINGLEEDEFKKQQEQKKNKSKDGNGLLQTLMEGLMKIGGGILSGIASLGMLIGGKLLTAVLGIGPGIVKGLGYLFQSSIGKGIMAGGKFLWNKGKAVTRSMKEGTLLDKVKNTLKSLTTKIAQPLKEKLGKNAAGKLIKKLGIKLGRLLVPGIGTTMLIYSLGSIGINMAKGKSLQSAVAEEFIGFDPWDEKSQPVDENGNPIEPDQEEIDKHNEKIEEDTERVAPSKEKTPPPETMQEQVNRFEEQQNVPSTYPKNAKELIANGITPFTDQELKNIDQHSIKNIRQLEQIRLKNKLNKAMTKEEDRMVTMLLPGIGAGRWKKRFSHSALLHCLNLPPTFILSPKKEQQ